MNNQKIRPYIHPLVQKFLDEIHRDFFPLKMQHEGPVHIIFPDIFSENIDAIINVLDDLEADYKVCFAHKVNKSDAFVLEARKKNISIDVASLGECQHAVSLGFTGKNITCSGPKSKAFLFLALSHNALISIDSISELETIISLQEIHNFSSPRVLIRINDLVGNDRKLVEKYTKFGIFQKDIKTICEKIQNTDIIVEGIHFHFDESNPEIKAGALENAIEIMQDLYAQGFSPTIIDIGGGYRGREIENMDDWKKYIDFLSEKKSHNEYSYTWGDRAYGLHINHRGGIEGRELVANRYKHDDACSFLKKMLTKKLADRIPVIERVNDSMFSLYLEPGYALANSTGLSIVRIIALKTVKNDRKAIVLDANITNFSSRMWEYFLDPILVKRDKDSPLQEGSYFLFGNLCRDDDILIQKEIVLEQQPEVGDIICFLHTASYISDFEDAQPIQQKSGKKLVAKRDKDQFIIYEDNFYNGLGFTKI